LILNRWPKLRKLNLSDCLLRPRGGVSVMTTLSSGSNPLLTSLLLQSNELDSRAINLLATAITQHLQHLTELELNGNYGEAEDECYVAIGEALEKWGHGDALDELDELEEQEEEESEEEEEEEEEESEVVKEDEKAEAAEPKAEDKGESDVLSNLLNKVYIA
jgi:Ran GTPase-activating protein 1